MNNKQRKEEITKMQYKISTNNITTVKVKNC